MAFHFRLEVSGELQVAARAPARERRGPPALSSYDELVVVLGGQCEALEATGAVRFHAGGFGQSTWPVDVRTDLAVVLEQLPEVMHGLRREGEFQLDFFEQGIETYLRCVRTGSLVAIECSTFKMDWTPEPSVESLLAIELDEMCRTLRATFSSAVERVCPWFSEGPAYQRWIEQTRFEPLA